MDWWRRLPGVVGAWNGHANGHADQTATWSVRPSTLRSRASPGHGCALSPSARTRNLTPKAPARCGARTGDGAAALAAQQRRLQQRRGGLFRPGARRSRTRPGARRPVPGLPRASAARSRRSSRSGGDSASTTGFERLRVGRSRRGDRLPGLRARQAALRAPRPGLVAALLLALMPYHVVVSRQVLLDGPMTMLRHAHAAPAGALRPERAASRGCTPPARRWGSPSSRRRRASCCCSRSTRSWRSRPSCACGCATSRSRWA